MYNFLSVIRKGDHPLQSQCSKQGILCEKNLYFLEKVEAKVVL